jgi:cytochrome c553
MVCGCARDEAPDGAALAEAKGCIACHGPDGVATAPAYPNLAGQWERYLRLQLLAYRAGRRENAIMAGFAGALSDAEIRALAQHYAGN